MSVDRNRIVDHLNEFLNISGIQDSSCNGLQVQGVLEIKKIGCAVDACLSVYEKAINAGCQMLLVHHGLIWGGLKSITGNLQRQIGFLLSHDLNLYGAHLPLDMHPVVGNNIVLALAIGLVDTRPFGLYKSSFIGVMGTTPRPMSAEEIGALLTAEIGGSHSLLPFGKPLNRTVAVVSGGGSEALTEAIDKGIDCFVTGEPLHWNHHAAFEGRVNVLYCGHYHTETVGVKALGKHIEETFGVETVFIDEPTLV